MTLSSIRGVRGLAFAGSRSSIRAAIGVLVASACLAGCGDDSAADTSPGDSSTGTPAERADTSVAVDSHAPGADSTVALPETSSNKPDASVPDDAGDASSGNAPEVSTVPLFPEIDGAWWQIASTPDLGTFNQAGEQPVDFAIWPSADGRWHVWSCIRGTS